MEPQHQENYFFYKEILFKDIESERLPLDQIYLNEKDVDEWPLQPPQMNNLQQLTGFDEVGGQEGNLSTNQIDQTSEI